MILKVWVVVLINHHLLVQVPRMLAMLSLFNYNLFILSNAAFEDAAFSKGRRLSEGGVH